MRRPTCKSILSGTELRLRLLLILSLRTNAVLHANDTREAIAKALGLTVAAERCVIDDYWVEADWISLVLDVDGRHNLPSLIHRLKDRSAAHAWAVVPRRLAHYGLKEGELWRPGFRVASLCAPRPVGTDDHRHGCGEGGTIDPD